MATFLRAELTRSGLLSASSRRSLAVAGWWSGLARAVAEENCSYSSYTNFSYEGGSEELKQPLATI